MSASAHIFLVGQERIMRPNASLMFHPFSNTQSMTQNASTLEALKRLEDRYVSIVTENTDMPEKAAREMMTGNSQQNIRYMFASEALKLGFATEIR